MKKVKFNKYVKHNQTRYAAGEAAEVSEEEYKGLVSAGVVASYEDVEPTDGLKDGDRKIDYEDKGETNDLFAMSAEELDKTQKHADLKAFLDAEKFEYPSDAKKADLIKLIVGE